MRTVMIIAGESSGELYGALLAQQLKRQTPDVHLIGIGGRRMREAGVELVAQTSDAFGLIEAVSSLKKITAALQSAVSALRKYNPDVLVLIDYPDFNFRIGQKAKALGTKILYYVSPQVWAWRKGRIKKIAGFVDRMAVILPFEEALYRESGVPCEFVGHPVREEIREVLGQKGEELSRGPEFRASLKTVLGLDPERPLLALLPGSRPSELVRHLPLMADVVKACKNTPGLYAKKAYQFCMPLAPNTEEAHFGRVLDLLRQEGVVVAKGESIRTLAASDMAVVASGTATFQTTLLEVPMVVIYKLSPITYHLGKRILNVKHISLVNILAGKEVVKELIQDRANPKEILQELQRIASDAQYREEMQTHYRNVKEPFLERNASKRVAEMVLEMAEKGHE